MAGERRVRLVEGDTLWGLGERFGVPWEHIQAFNKLPDDVVYAGEELKLPPQRTKAWVVEPGDCAWEISVRFGLTLEELREVNAGIPEVLYPGDLLFVPADAVRGARQLWNLRAVKARLKGIAAHANAKFFDVFPYPQGPLSCSCSLPLSHPSDTTGMVRFWVMFLLANEMKEDSNASENA